MLLTPIPVGSSPTNISLTSDGTRLAVLNSTDGTISVIDPVMLKVLATYAGYTKQDQSNCPNTPGGYSMAALQSHLAAVALNCPFVVHIVGLDSGTISCSGIAGCDGSGTILNAPFAVAALASSTDGSKLFMSGGFSPVALLNLSANTLLTDLGIESQGWSAASNADMNLFASTLAIYDSQVVRHNLISGVGYFSTENQGELGGGEAFNPSGSLLFMPSSGVDVFDVHRGRLAMRVGLPDPPSIPRGPSIALNETGTKVFVLTRSGLTIAQLASLPLSIASTTPSSGASGTTVTIRGSGFQSGTKISFGSSAAAVTYVDGMTLKATVPALASGPSQITVVNPDGQSYSFDAAFLVN